MSRRRFGRLRRPPSGRWQPRYPGDDGIDRPAPTTFATKTQAARWLSLAESELVRGTIRGAGHEPSAGRAAEVGRRPPPPEHPGFLVAVMLEHLREFDEDGPDGHVFVGPRGGPLRRQNFAQTARWREAVAEVGIPGLHFHDLRHTGNTLAAPLASTRELMARLGHNSPRAADLPARDGRTGPSDR